MRIIHLPCYSGTYLLINTKMCDKNVAPAENIERNNSNRDLSQRG